MDTRSLGVWLILSLSFVACGSPLSSDSSPTGLTPSADTAQEPTAAATTSTSPETAICVGREQAEGWDRVPPIVQRLGDAWMAPDQPTRLAILEEIWAVDGVYVNAFDEQPVVGRQAVADYMAFGMADNYLEITDWDPIYMHSDRVQIRWRDCCPNGTVLLTGTEYGEFDSDGRFSRVTSFWDHYIDEAVAEACG